jgi:hypothetical protein
MSEWNPRYEQYCRAHGYIPGHCPDKSNAEFICWSNQQIVAAYRQHPEFFVGSAHHLLDHDGYDAWMVARVTEQLAERQLGEVNQ